MSTNRWIIRGFFCIILITFAAGCGTSGHQTTHVKQSPSTSITSQAAQSNRPINTPISTPKNDGTIAPAQTSLSNPKQPAQVDNEGKSTSSPVLNKLMGLALDVPKSQVVKLYGSPQSIFEMNDPLQPLTVYQYTNFSVGFNTANQIVFITINGSKADPGLNGLQLGQSQKDAIKALGTPTTMTKYVLTYQSSSTVLKLDIDPQNGTIISIKLFASEN